MRRKAERDADLVRERRRAEAFHLSVGRLLKAVDDCSTILVSGRQSGCDDLDDDGDGDDGDSGSGHGDARHTPKALEHHQEASLGVERLAASSRNKLEVPGGKTDTDGPDTGGRGDGAGRFYSNVRGVGARAGWNAANKRIGLGGSPRSREQTSEHSADNEEGTWKYDDREVARTEAAVSELVVSLSQIGMQVWRLKSGLATAARNMECSR